MASPGLVYKGFLQFGREATWNTAVAATHRIPFLKMAVDVEHGRIVSRAMDGKKSPVNVYVGGKRWRATIELELTYTGFLHLIDGLMGTATYGSNGGATTGTNPYTHTFRQKDLHSSYTFQFGMGDVPTGKCERGAGGKILEATFSGGGSLEGAEAVITARLVIVGGTYTVNETPTAALTALTPDPVLFSHCTIEEDGTNDDATPADVEIRRFSLTVKNPLADGRFILDSSGVIHEPIRNRKIDDGVVLEIDQEFRTKTAIDSFFLTYATGAPNLKFVSGSKSIEFLIPVAFLRTAPKHDPEGDDIMNQKLVWHGLDDDSNDSALTIIVINAQSAITA